MRDKQYYPTPKSIIGKMLEGYDREDFKGKYILDPSAGEGAILEFIERKAGSYSNVKLHAIEIDPDFRHTLSGKDFTVIGEDFLQFDQQIYFDLIVMNPPFNDGVKHLLKAWDILYSGDIICLLNAESILNPFSKDRQRLASIIEKNGSTEVLGNVFKNAPIPAEVNVVMVKLHKEAKESMFDPDDFDKSHVNVKFTEETYKNLPARKATISNLEIMKENADKAFVDFLKAYNKLNFYLKPLLPEYNSTFETIKNIIKDNGSDAHRYNEFINTTKRFAWKVVLDSGNLDRLLTSSVRQDFGKFISNQSNMAFTLENVMKVIEMLVMNQDTIMHNAVVDVFDHMTKFHKDNKVDEGWKTNDSWKVNRKVIIPWAVRYGEYASAESLKQWGDKFSTNWNNTSILLDIDKVMCYLSGLKIENIVTINKALDHHFEWLGHIKTGQKFDNKVNSTFFQIRFWKKGTMHLYFFDEELWQKFNIEAARGKGWLPQAEQKKESKEEKETQLSFNL